MAKDYLDFLTALSENNAKSWMDENRDWYLATREAFLEDVEIILHAISAWEPALSSFKAKDCVFRQNRDIRFSANKNPYKSNLAAYFAVGGKKSDGPGYYLHIQPGKSFLAGGIWMPGADALKCIRQEIDYAGAELKGILEEKTFYKTFGEMEGERLKTSPRGYETDHPYIDYLNHKSLIVSQAISDKEVATGDFKQKATATFRLMKPFHEFLAKAIDETDSGDGLLGPV